MWLLETHGMFHFGLTIAGGAGQASLLHLTAYNLIDQFPSQAC